MKEGGRGRGRKETLGDKPFDFENLRSSANAAPDWRGWSADWLGWSEFPNLDICANIYPSRILSFLSRLKNE